MNTSNNNNINMTISASIPLPDPIPAPAPPQYHYHYDTKSETAATPPSPLSSEIYVYQTIIYFAKRHRYLTGNIFDAAEENNAFIRKNQQEGQFFREGIFYRGKNLIIHLVFTELANALQFQSFIRNLQWTSGGYNDEITKEIRATDEELTKVYGVDYLTNAEEEEETYQKELAVVNNDTTKLRLLSNPNSPLLHLMLLKVCHLRLESVFEHERENILFMDTSLQCSFDGTNCIDKVPLFYVEYHSHSSIGIPKIIQTHEKQELNVLVYETKVTLTFYSQRLLLGHRALLRENELVSGNTLQLRLSLFFEQPLRFKEFAAFRAEIIRRQWREKGLLD